MPALCWGVMPAWYDGDTGLPIIYESKLAAQREIAGHHLTVIQQFLDGTRDYDDAMKVEDFVLPVDIWSDGSISNESGRRYGKQL